MYVCLGTIVYDVMSVRGAYKGRGGGVYRAATDSKSRNLKKADFVDTRILSILHNLPFSRNQPLKSADDYYIGILKNKIKKFRS
jgi:hypothetical protein